MRQQTVNRVAGSRGKQRHKLPARLSARPAIDGVLFRFEAVGCELVAVEIADIGRIGTGMPAAWPGWAFILAAGCEGGLVEFCNRSAARRDEADRAAIGEARRLSVGRLQHEEFRGRLTPDRTVVAQIVQTLVA